MLRRLILAVVIFALTFGTSCFSGIGPLEIISSVLSDDTGNTFIAYRVERSPGDHDIHLQKIDPEGAVLWDNTLFTGNDGRADVVGMVSDGNSGVFIAWEVLTPEDGKKGPHRFDRVTLMKVDAQGQIQQRQDLFEKGLQMVDDGMGGVILGWATKEDYRVLREDGHGSTLWAQTIIGRGTGLKLAAEENGESFILWDNRDNPYFVAQKLGADDQLLWGQEGMPEGIRIKHLETALQAEPQIISDGSGGAIVTWAEALGGGLPSYVWACRIRADGQVLCEEPIRDLTSPINVYTRVVADGSGGAIVVWEDHRDVMTLYAQKVNTEGEAQWQENGIPVCTGLPEVSPRFEVTGNGDGGVVVAWIDGDRKLLIQMIDASGQRLWDNKGVLIASGVCSLPVKLSGTGENGFIIGWSTGVEAYHPNDSYLQKIDSDGNLLWGQDGIQLDSKAGGAE
ncbi:MAG TPA: hypothetical protein VMW37_05255 [Dehalococcoidales bacterium]|nr:hypothetical protein [Dehalococcoidales bacterium]